MLDRYHLLSTPGGWLIIDRSFSRPILQNGEPVKIEHRDKAIEECWAFNEVERGRFKDEREPEWPPKECDLQEDEP
jgi:hypothetical protein